MKFFYENLNYDIIIWEEENFTFPSAHWHTKVELAIVLDGTIYVSVNKEKKLLQKGDGVILGSGDIHYYDGTNTNAKMFILIFKPELINYFSGWPENKRFLSHFLLSDEINKPLLKELKSLMYLIKNELDTNNIAKDIYIKSYLLKICAIFSRYMPMTPIKNNNNAKVLTTLKLLQDISIYIDKNYMKDISIESMAKHFNMSPKYFSKLFNSITSLNFKTYINTIRISKAEAMIVNTTDSLTTIALECGFNSIRTFNRVYKTLKGQVPSNLRK